MIPNYSILQQYILPITRYETEVIKMSKRKILEVTLLILTVLLTAIQSSNAKELGSGFSDDL